MAQSQIGTQFRITEIRAKNFRSIGDVTLSLGNLTTLVGRNASGKSNLMDIARFVSEALQGDLDSAITRRGGMSSLRRWSARRPHNIEVGIKAEGRGGLLEYGFVLAAKSGGQYAVQKEQGQFWTSVEASPINFLVENGLMSAPTFLIPKGKTREPVFLKEDVDGGPRELALPLIRRFGGLVQGGNRYREFYSFVSRFLRNMAGMRFYHIFPNEIREIQKPTFAYPLEEHGENFASVLKKLRTSHRMAYMRIVRAIGNLVPGIDNFEVRQTGGYLVARLHHAEATEQGEPTWFETAQEADGTLRLLGILVALYQYPPPAFLGIEEPELNVHPGAVAKLADYFIESSRRSQIMLTTHSPELIDRLPPESIRAVSLQRGVTTAGRVSKKQMEAVRRHLFSLGEIHQSEGLEPETLE